MTNFWSEIPNNCFVESSIGLTKFGVVKINWKILRLWSGTVLLSSILLIIGSTTSNSAFGSITNNGIDINLESGYSYFDSQIGLNWYEQAIKLTNNSSTQFMSGCDVTYSWFERTDLFLDKTTPLTWEVCLRKVLNTQRFLKLGTLEMVAYSTGLQYDLILHDVICIRMIFPEAMATVRQCNLGQH